MGRPPATLCFKCETCGELYRISDKHICKKEKERVKVKGYIEYTEVTKDILDKLQVGDLVKINEWKKPMRIMGASENYAVMIQKQFKDTYYSVIEKKPRTAGKHNSMRKGFFHCGKDDFVFGDMKFNYTFNDAEAVATYLANFEVGKTKLSERNAIPILSLQVKHVEDICQGCPNALQCLAWAKDGMKAKCNQWNYFKCNYINGTKGNILSAEMDEIKGGRNDG